MYVLNTSRTHLRKLTNAGLCLTLCVVLPFLTGQIPEIGKMLCPMHLPAFLAGFLCGPWFGLAVGLIAPPLRFLLFGMPALYPTAVAMSFELGTYAWMAGLLYRRLPKKNSALYATLIVAMIAGRAVWGVVMAILSGASSLAFTWQIFLTGAFTNAIPGIIIQLLVIPVLVLMIQCTDSYT